METVDLDMGDLFDDQAGEDQDFGAAPISLDEEDQPMDEDDMEATQGDGDGDVLDRLRDISKGAAKKRVMNPQPKLNAERLRGNRGLPVVPKIFDGIKFRGKGHEASDLKLLMGKLEHWGHRMFPKLPFDDLIERLEKLGTRRDVQNCVKRIRLDMPMLDEDFVQQYDDEDNENKPPQDDEDATRRGENREDDLDAEEAFDEMIRQEREIQGSPARAGSPAAADDVTPDVELAGKSPERAQVTAAAKTASPKTNAMTDEVRERMERNKRLAMERRMKRMGMTPPNKGAASPSRVTPIKNCSASSPGQDKLVTSQSSTVQRSPSSSASPSKAVSSASPQEDSSLRLHLSESPSQQKDVSGEQTDREGSESFRLHLTETQTPGDSMEDGQNKLPETERTDSTFKNSVVLSESSLTENRPGNDKDEDSEGAVIHQMDSSQESTLHLRLTESETIQTEDKDTNSSGVELESKSGDNPESDEMKTGTSGEDTLQLKLSVSDNETAATDTSMEDAVIL